MLFTVHRRLRVVSTAYIFDFHDEYRRAMFRLRQISVRTFTDGMPISIGHAMNRMHWGIIAMFFAVLGVMYLLVRLGWIRDY